jgi:carnitine O-acetyltransferase
MPFPSYQKMTNMTTTSHRPFTSSLSSSAVVVPRPWENEKIMADGDYTHESWLEDPSLPLYQYQDKLPRLPVPELHETLRTFLPTALPLAQNESETVALKAAVEKFPTQAAILHERLLQRAQDWNNTRRSSWLQLYWNQMGYLDVRDSVVVNVSYYFAFGDDPTARSYIQRAAAMLTAVGQFRHGIVTGQKPADMIGKSTPLCSTAYKYMFHACRIPQLHRDAVAIYDPARYTHAVVAVRGQFFAVDFLDPITHQPFSLVEIEAALEQCVRMADNDDGSMPNLGVCTAMNRDDWTAARAVLLQDGHTAALERLESGAVLLCLDIDQNPVSHSEVAKLLLHGDSRNRWYDKSIQLIVSKNGKAGLMGEHALMDGMPVVQLADAITKLKYGDISKKQQAMATPTTTAVHTGTATRIFQQPLPTRLLQPHIAKAERDFANLTGTNELTVCRFDGYGSTFMKKAGYSPDAYAQMAMQIATYRLWHGVQGGTYESTQVRPFLHGRTETTRTVSMESANLCQLFGARPAGDEHDAIARSRKLQALDLACTNHVQYLKLAGQGRGVDRHFFGLSCMATVGETLPDLYRDPVFQRSKRWRVSTSHLTHPSFDSWGYGPVVDDGVGLAYSVHPRHCVFTVTAHARHGGWPDQLATLLQEALIELQTTIELEQLSKGSSTPTSKL